MIRACLDHLDRSSTAAGSVSRHSRHLAESGVGCIARLLDGRSALRAGLWPRAAPPGAGRGSMSATPGVRSEDVAPFMPLADRSAAGGSLRSRRGGFFSSRSPYTRCITQLGRSRPVG
jgi:hypothetical protein